MYDEADVVFEAKLMELFQLRREIDELELALAKAEDEVCESSRQVSITLANFFEDVEALDAAKTPSVGMAKWTNGDGECIDLEARWQSLKKQFEADNALVCGIAECVAGQNEEGRRALHDMRVIVQISPKRHSSIKLITARPDLAYEGAMRQRKMLSYLQSTKWYFNHQIKVLARQSDLLRDLNSHIDKFISMAQEFFEEAMLP